MKRKNYFWMGLILPLIAVFLVVGISIVFVNMQHNLFDEDYKLFDFLVKENQEVLVTVLNNEYNFSLGYGDDIKTTVQKMSIYSPQIFKLMADGYTKIQTDIYRWIDEILQLDFSILQ